MSGAVVSTVAVVLLVEDGVVRATVGVPVLVVMPVLAVEPPLLWVITYPTTPPTATSSPSAMNAMISPLPPPPRRGSCVGPGGTCGIGPGV